MSISFEDPVVAWALLAVIFGLRLALFVAERWVVRQPAAPVSTLLSPDGQHEDIPVQPEPIRPDNSEASHPYRFINELLDSALIAVFLVFFVIRPFVLQAFYIPSKSMEPTLQINDKLIVLKYAYRFGEPQHGDVVVFRAPKVAVETSDQPQYDPRHPVDYVKRVVAVGNDRIRVVAGEGVYRNGTLVHEPYTAASPDYDFPTDRRDLVQGASPEIRESLRANLRDGELLVPPGYLFVMGDNRRASHDSHRWGLLPKKALIGKAVFIFWPLNRIGRVE